MQEQILERYPQADLRVYVVWLPVMPLDNNRVAVTDTMPDRRATHFWDNERSVSDELARAYGSPGQLLWDEVFVFGPDAKWGSGPPRPLGSGSPVVAAVGTLNRLLKPYLV